MLGIGVFLDLVLLVSWFHAMFWERFKIPCIVGAILFWQRGFGELHVHF